MFIGMFVPAKAIGLAKKLEKKENGKKDLSVISRVVNPVGIFGSHRVSGEVGTRFHLRLSKCFGPISGLHTKLFYIIHSNDSYHS